MSILDRISSAILSFLLALFVFLTAMCSVVRFTFCSPAFMVSVLKEQSYYNVIYDEYCESIEQLAIPAGVAEGEFSKVVSKAEFSGYINDIIYAAYDSSSEYSGKLFPYDEIHNRFYNVMLNTAENAGVTVDDELVVGVDHVSTLLANSTQQYVTLPFIDTIGKYGLEISGYLNYAILGGAIILLFFVAVLLLTKKWRVEWVNVVTLAARSSGAMLIIAPLAVLVSNVIKYLNIDVKSLYLFAVGYAETIVWTLFILGIILFILGTLPQIIKLIKYIKFKKAGAEQ